jgi:hypothetical protein
LIDKNDDDLLIALKENPLAGAVWPSEPRIVAVIDDDAGKDSVNARTAGINDFVSVLYFIKKKEWHSPQVCEELQWYFARWRVKTGLAVR